jgi:hypothetical protein
VRIRRVDAPAGDDADATLARVEASATRGDVDAAFADLQKLPPDRRAAFDAWIKKAEARRAALAAALRLARESTTALGKE